MHARLPLLPCRDDHASGREQTVEEVLQAQEAIKNTGFEELALLSLSSSDYTNVLELVTEVGEKFGGTHLKIGLPSLRIRSVSIDLMEKLKDSRSGGFTLAPKAPPNGCAASSTNLSRMKK